MQIWFLLDLNVIGLILDLVGGVLLYFFGLAPLINPEGSISIIAEQKDENEIKKAKKYIFLSRLGVLLFILGSLLQLISYFV